MRYLAKYDCYIDGDCNLYVLPKNKDYISCVLRHINPRLTADKRYYKVTIRGVTYQFHDIVSYAFHGEKPKGYVVDHRDRDTYNNNPDNLHYCKPSENIANRIQTIRNVERDGFRRCENIKEWSRLWRERNPDRVKATNHKSYYAHVANGERFRLCADGKRHWIKVND